MRASEEYTRLRTGESPDPGIVLFFANTGTFDLLGHPLCLENPNLPAVPSVGDKVLVAFFNPPADREERVFSSYFDAVVVERARSGGGLSVGPEWEEAFRGFHDLGQVVETLSLAQDEIEEQ